MNREVNIIYNDEEYREIKGNLANTITRLSRCPKDNNACSEYKSSCGSCPIWSAKEYAIQAYTTFTGTPRVPKYLQIDDVEVWV